MLGKSQDCSFYLVNLFSESKPFTETSLFLIKNDVHFRWEVRQCLGYITRSLLRSPMKVQSLSLLIGSGSDRQQERWLFRFHFYLIWTYSLIYLANYWCHLCVKYSERYLGFNSEQNENVITFASEIDIHILKRRNTRCRRNLMGSDTHCICNICQCQHKMAKLLLRSY